MNLFFPSFKQGLKFSTFFWSENTEVAKFSIFMFVLKIPVTLCHVELVSTGATRTVSSFHHTWLDSLYYTFKILFQSPKELTLALSFVRFDFQCVKKHRILFLYFTLSTNLRLVPSTREMRLLSTESMYQLI